jgi:phosphatidylglycerophosphatase A
VPERQKPMSALCARALSTVFGIGYLRPGPGTWGATVTVFLWYIVGQHVAVNMRLFALTSIAAAITALAIPAATRAAQFFGEKDPSQIVIDEVAGQLFAMFAVPVRWPCLLLSLIAFRAFDIIKPWPVRAIERLPGGSGIVLDDVAAGLYALIAVQLLVNMLHL